MRIFTHQSRQRSFFALTLVIAFFLTFIGATPIAAESSKQENRVMSFRKKFGPVRAPELRGGNGWLNTDKPLSLAGLKGKVVLLDFWTYCCINCMHIIPDLKKLEAGFPNELVVIGVHSAKFDNEKGVENIRQAILRYEIAHPVVNDSNFEIWQQYAARAWPTLVLIDAEGYVAGAYSGEGHYAELDADIKTLIAEAKGKGILKSEPLDLTLERSKIADMPLSFPGKVLADTASKRLFIADSNHNRIVVSTLEGGVLWTIGKGTVGTADGGFGEAEFNHPQGMALVGDALYVADTENHLVRKIDFTRKTVETVAGTGTQGYDREPNGNGRKISLASPWDLQPFGDALLIAMAGTHQIWKLDLKSNVVTRFAGSGAENCIDGPADQAALAQPSGLATDGKTLFVADSEVSTIRAIDGQGKVASLVGSRDLFGFGDIDAAGTKARLQHPLGIAFHQGKLFVADTYNHKIKVVDPATGTIQTLLGTGKSGRADGTKAEFFEPGGLSVAGDTLYIADTNNHAVRTYDFKTGTVGTLMLKGLAPVMPVAESASEIFPNAERIALPTQTIKPDAESELRVTITLPEGYHINANTPNRVRLDISDGKKLSLDTGVKTGALALQLAKQEMPLRIPFTATGKGTGRLTIKTTFFYCRTDNTGVCKIQSVIWDIPIETAPNGKSAIDLSYAAK